MFCSLNRLFGGVLVAVVILLCLISLIIDSGDKDDFIENKYVYWHCTEKSDINQKVNLLQGSLIVKYSFLVSSNVFQKISIVIMCFCIVRKSFNPRSKKQKTKENRKTVLTKQWKMNPIVISNLNLCLKKRKLVTKRLIFPNWIVAWHFHFLSKINVITNWNYTSFLDSLLVQKWREGRVRLFEEGGAFFLILADRRGAYSKWRIFEGRGANSMIYGIWESRSL